MPPIRYRALFPPLLFPLLRHQTLALVLPALTLGASALALPATKVETLDDGGPRIVVRQDGLGDATTIQGGIGMYVTRLASGEVDTIVVMPGEYEERVVIPSGLDPGWIVCPGGPDVTRVRAMEPADSTRRVIGQQRWAVVGLGIREHVSFGPSHEDMAWRGCRFEEGYTAQGGSCSTPNELSDCEFDGPVKLIYFTAPGEFVGLRFRHAPLFVMSDGCGTLAFRGCTFEGPADTAVVAFSIGDAGIIFYDCSFTGLERGVVGYPTHQCDEGLIFLGCRFADVSEDAIAYRFDPSSGGQQGCARPLGLGVHDCRFDRCGRAVNWLTTDAGNMAMTRDTIMDCRHEGIVATTNNAGIRDTRVERSGGHGVVLYRVPDPIIWNLVILDSEFLDNAGEGLVVRDTNAAVVTVHGRIEGNAFVGNGGTGLRFRGRGETVQSNLIARNRGAGLAYELHGSPSDDYPDTEKYPAHDSLVGNTIVLNGGDGLVVRDLGSRPEQTAWVSRNLVAGNGGVGLRTEGPAILPTEHNDAWMNVGGAYEGRPGGSEDLTLDPRFCDVPAGDYHVQAASPCAEAGSYGRIGAFGVGCEVSAVPVVVEPQRINRRSREAVTAVMSGGRLLDVNRVDASTLRLAGVAPGVPGSGREVVEVRDADGDGYADLVAKFEARSLSLPVGERRVALEAATVDGGPLRGEAQVTVVGASQVPLAEAAESRGAPLPARLTLGSRASREGALVVRLGLPRAAPVRMEALDVAGRRVAVRMLPGNTVGWLAVRLGDRLSPGLYFVRATQGAETAAAKALVLR